MVDEKHRVNAGRSPRAEVRWLGPAPLWAQPGPAGLRLTDSEHTGRPAILRFDHDDFMPEFIHMVQSEPERLGEWIARPETWRQPMTSPRPSRAGQPQSSQVAYLLDRTHKMAEAKKPVLPKAMNLQAFQSRLKKPSLPEATTADAQQVPLKLFQPAQKRHYLISASLINEEPGLPDCLPDLTRREKVSFVVRRLMPPDEKDDQALEQWDEYAFVAGSGPNSWHRVGNHSSTLTRTLAPGEEQLPMFPVSYQSPACRDNRKLFNGSIPVGRREQWVGAQRGPDVAGGNQPEATAAGGGRSMASMLLETDVVAPWKLLLEQAELKKNAAQISFPHLGTDASGKAQEHKRLLRSARDELQTGSWYVLLDFALFVHKYLPHVWQVLQGEKELAGLDEGGQELVRALRATVLSGELAWEIITGKPVDEHEGRTHSEEILLHLLKSLEFCQKQSPGSGSAFWIRPGLYKGWGSDIPDVDAPYPYTTLKWTLAEALVAAFAAEKGLEEVETTLIRFDSEGKAVPVDSNWPGFLFPLADPDHEPPLPLGPDSEPYDLEGRQAAVDRLAEMVRALLPAGESAEELMDMVPQGQAGQAWFVIRCVYERPGCGPLFPALVSGATQTFQMAPFFDPDAPARAVRIPMPMDISPAGLRKYQKNAGFVISDMLCAKIKGIRKMSLADLVLSVLPWPFHKDLPDPGSGTCKENGSALGMICSLSIPIVTLCALILMMIMVALFDLVFRWIPYLFICLPIPGLKGKKGGGG